VTLLPIFQPEPCITRVDLPDGRFCVVVDDALCDPHALVAMASAARAQFRPVDFNAYPGIHLPASHELEAAFAAFFERHIRPRFPARQLLRMHARLAMVTTPPRQLRPCQWLCHADDFDVAPGRSIQAAVLYLFEDKQLGGTSFYEPKGTAQATRQLFADALAMPPAVFARRYGWRPGYMAGDNAFFRRIGQVDARWNRLVFYDGAMLHSGDIDAPDRLTDDPETGRLTLNGFFTCRRDGP